jgi:hypothetical protein
MPGAARRSLLQIAEVVRPLRVAADTASARAAARAAGVLNDDGVSSKRRLWRRHMAAVPRLPTQLATCQCRFEGCGGVRLPRPAMM